jgi:cytosine deaminase
MQRIHAIRNARIRDRARLCDITLTADGVIREIADAGRTIAGNAEIDAQGMLVLPSPIDSHLHLDLAYSMELMPPNVSGTLGEAIRHWSETKRSLTPDDVCRRAVRAVRDEVGFGTGHIRTHVDVGTAAGLRLCEGVLLAREQTRDWVDIQVVAFPQDGILQDRGAVELIREALGLGCDLIGGIAHNERTAADSRRHVDLLFDLAEEFDRDIDCHIDETDDPGSRCVEELAAGAIERGWQGRVTASHVCALASYDESHAAGVIDLLAAARVHVVTNPGVNLHLQGRHDRYPKRRGLTRVRQLLAAGVNVSAGQDCIQDPFYPLGTGNLFDVGHLLIHADHLSTPAQIDQVTDMITANAARTLGLDRYGLVPGKAADLVVLPVESTLDAFRVHRSPVAVVKNGMCVARQGEVEVP